MADLFESQGEKVKETRDRRLNDFLNKYEPASLPEDESFERPNPPPGHAGSHTLPTQQAMPIPLTPPHTIPQKRNPMHVFSSFCELPESVSFQTQEDDEIILLFLRKSLITNIPWIIIALLFAIVPIGLFVFGAYFTSPFSLLPSNFLLVIFLFYYLFVATYIFINFITWYFNISIVTQDRVVDIDFSDLVYKNISETKLGLVQDVSYTQSGVVRTLFDFGDVLIQTAGTVDNFDLTAIPNPERTVQVVEGLIGKGRVPAV